MINKLKNNKKHRTVTSAVLLPNGDFKASESYKAIRTNIIHMLADIEEKTILITSPYAGAGKTTTCANLAITFSQLGKKVLIIDADMRKPTMHKLFSLHLSSGLSDILSGKNEYKIQKTGNEGLFILTAGSIPANPSELLHSPKFAQLLKEFSKEYDFVFVDAPPVDAVTDAVVISQNVSGTLLVIRQNSTEKEALVRTVSSLKKVNANILGYEKFSYRYGHYTGKYGARYETYYYYSSHANESSDSGNSK